MKIKFDRRVEALFLGMSLLGIAGRKWVLPDISWQQQAILFVMTLAMLNGVWAFHYGFNQWLNGRFPLEKNVRKRLAIQLLGGWAIVKTVLFFCSLLILHYIVPTLSHLINRLMLLTISWGAFMANIVVGLGFIAHHLFVRWQENLTRTARLEQEKAQVQYDNLRNQLNPHFLFNSLSSLDSLIDDDPALARQFLQQLSKVFRYVLQHKSRDLVPLSTELVFINQYVSLLQTRFNGEFQVHCHISDEARDRLIAPVTLQILIENAIKHNVISEAQPLVVELVADSDYLSVTNAVQRKKLVTTSNGQGLQHLQQLYAFMSEQPVDIANDGHVFRVRIPLLS
ncbi:sensor histidine kinase [Fibrella aquatilis]|uniref:Histidine kinase n=1 Tax=Fibrella aquatilis TaxID=2817059 RepID=A0A939G6E2_9BACT|nr:histidine kinase [Fibrella aquatilis]MBO0933252.1 histidine kinase [Fibrella aquatilis]